MSNATMTRAQALVEARRRFGFDVRLRVERHGVHRLYRLGLGNGWPEVIEIGRGQSWEEAIAKAIANAAKAVRS